MAHRPLFWVPSSFFAMGVVCITVTSTSNIVFSNLGCTNEQAAAYSSMAGLAYVLSPSWAPFIELNKTQKFFVLLVQALLGLLFWCLSAALARPEHLAPLRALLTLAAIAGATQDIATNGVYVTALDWRARAAYSGLQSASWGIGPVFAIGMLVLLVGKLAHEVRGGPRPTIDAYAHAWALVFVGLGLVMVALAAWHWLMLPTGRRAPEASPSTGALKSFTQVALSFFQKQDLWKLVGLAFTYRLGLGLLDKIAPLFVLDSRQRGGLGLDDSELGLLNGLATGAFLLASLAGGWFITQRGLKKSLLLMCLAMNVPNLSFVYLAWAKPTSLTVVGAAFLLEKIGWGFGGIGHIYYMMEQIAPGPYKTAHYAFAFGVGLNLCMMLTGVVSGFIQASVGYQAFFVIACSAAVPSLAFASLAPFHQRENAAG